jgi:hypothetical protein
MKADLSGIMWLVAPVSATRRDVQGCFKASRKEMEYAGGFIEEGQDYLGETHGTNFIGIRWG